jgi:hypothetical protein
LKTTLLDIERCWAVRQDGTDGLRSIDCAPPEITFEVHLKLHHRGNRPMEQSDALFAQTKRGGAGRMPMGRA